MTFITFFRKCRDEGVFKEEEKEVARNWFYDREGFNISDEELIKEARNLAESL